MTSPVALADFQFYLKDNSADGDYLDFLQRLLDASYEGVVGIVGYDYTPDITITYKFFGTGLNWKQVPGLYIDTATATLSSTYRNEGPVPLASSEFWLVDRMLFTTPCFYGTRYYTLVVKINDGQDLPQMIASVNMEWAYHMLDKSRRGIGSLGKVTDFSNVLGQSSLRYQPDASVIARFREMLSSLIVY